MAANKENVKHKSAKKVFRGVFEEFESDNSTEFVPESSDSSGSDIFR